MKNLILFAIVGALIWLMIQFPHTMLNPGELVQAHQKLNSKCLDCHQPLKGISNEKCIACHKTGGQAPDLTSANAYSQISSKYVKTASAETSLIYTEPAPANAAVHTWKKYSASEAALVLAWIKEGAKNN